MGTHDMNLAYTRNRTRVLDQPSIGVCVHIYKYIYIHTVYIYIYTHTHLKRFKGDPGVIYSFIYMCNYMAKM